MDEKFTGLWLSGSDLKSFESRAKGMWRRDYQFKNYTIDEQQIIQLSCIKDIQFSSFVDFASVVKGRCMLSESREVIDSLSINIIIKSGLRNLIWRIYPRSN